MYTQLEAVWFSPEALGCKASDDRLLDWFPGYLGMGRGGNPVWLKSVIRYRTLERDGVFAEILAQLRPYYNEDMDVLLERMPTTPGGGIALSSDADWRSRSSKENDRWVQHCRKTRGFLSKIMVLMGEVGVVAARIMNDRDGPPTPDATMRRMYHQIGDMVGTHDAIFNATTRVQEHLRA